MINKKICIKTGCAWLNEVIKDIVLSHNIILKNGTADELKCVELKLTDVSNSFHSKVDKIMKRLNQYE